MLLTRSPLSPGPKPWFSLDLHVLGAPPAFVLSQDQTLREETGCSLSPSREADRHEESRRTVVSLRVVESFREAERRSKGVSPRHHREGGDEVDG